jgi:invasion protein IalB
MRQTLRIVMFAALALSAGLAFAQTDSPPNTVKSRHGDWQLRCEAQPAGQAGTRDQCALVQSVADEDDPAVTLVAIVLKASGGKDRILRIIAPLGVLLPNGLGLKIDEREIGRAGFVRCLPPGCVAEVTMDDGLLGQLRSGKVATFIIFTAPDKGIGIPVTLAGFAEGFDALP